VIQFTSFVFIYDGPSEEDWWFDSRSIQAKRLNFIMTPVASLVNVQSMTGRPGVSIM